jgi:leucyl/phenylalanyl-tRNA--protein transferase
MVIKRFPDPRHSTPEGIVAVGGDLEPESLLLAYRQGIFPWPISDLPLTWFCPPTRAILEWDQLHIPRSLVKTRKKNLFQFTFDQAFSHVIEACSQIPRPHQPGTWITDEIKQAYCKLHELGHAHSIEVWKDQQLVGGLYGVDAGGVFAGESMFYLEPNASKLAILTLMEHLHAKGSHWMDIQVLTPHMEAMGAREVPRNEFLNRLKETLQLKIELFPHSSPP